MNQSIICRRIGLLFYVLFGLGTLFCWNYQGFISHAADGETLTLVTETESDRVLIPDKYNTGAKGELITVDPGSTFYIGDTKVEYRKLDLFYQKTPVPDELVFENYDFSQSDFSVQNANRAQGRSFHLIFKNCKFKSFSMGSEGDVLCEFENCSFTHFAASDSNCTRCYFGSGDDGDAINPGVNCKFVNCMVADILHPLDTRKDNHVDGFQIFGSESGPNENIHLKNCRFETPAIPFSCPSGAMNCPITMTMRYSGANNILIEDCYINGGVWYALQLRAIDQNVTNLVVKNLKIGGSSPNAYDVDEQFLDMVRTNTQMTDLLYVSTVEKKADGVHIVCSNDTRVARTMAVVTNNGVQNVTIEPCPCTRMIAEDSMIYEDFPFDIDIIIPDADWVVCYDVTDEIKQIRFVNWSANKVYVNLSGKEISVPESSHDSVTDIFADINENDWWVDPIQYVYDRGIMIGKGKNRFGPTDKITREEFVQILYSIAGKPVIKQTNRFSDVEFGKWYYNAVIWAYNSGVATGYGNGKFGIGDNITREAVAVMLYKYANQNGYDMTTDDGKIDFYSDAKEVSGWAKQQMNWAITGGIISGKGSGGNLAEYKLDPRGTATRAECAAMIVKLLIKNK